MGNWKLKVSVTAAKTKGVLLREERGDDPGSGAKMLLLGWMVLLPGESSPHRHLW